MKTINLQIMRRELSEDYEKALKESNFNFDKSSYLNRNNPFSMYKSEEILNVEITEKQFEAIRKEVLKNF